MSTTPTAAQPGVEEKFLTSSILLWVRTRPRQTGTGPSHTGPGAPRQAFR